MRKAGFKTSEETKIKIRVANTGRIFSDEWKENMSKAQKGKPSPLKGRKFVDENISKEKRSAYIKEWRLKNKEKIKEKGSLYGKEYRLKNKEKILENARLKYQENKETELDRIRYKKYGITGDEYREMVRKQEGICPICLKTDVLNLSVDHDHITGKIRGIICNKCNMALGNVGDSPEILRRLADYLERSL